MPVRVEKRGSQFCVVKTDTGETEKCYSTSGEARRYATALNLAHARAKGYVHNDRPLGDDVIKELTEWDA